MLLPIRRFCMLATMAITPFASIGAFAQGGNADQLFEPIRAVLQHPRCQN